MHILVSKESTTLAALLYLVAFHCCFVRNTSFLVVAIPSQLASRVWYALCGTQCTRSHSHIFPTYGSAVKIGRCVLPKSYSYVNHTPFLVDVWIIFAMYLWGSLYQIHGELYRKIRLRSYFVDNVKVWWKNRTENMTTYKRTLLVLRQLADR